MQNKHIQVSPGYIQDGFDEVTGVTPRFVLEAQQEKGMARTARFSGFSEETGKTTRPHVDLIKVLLSAAPRESDTWGRGLEHLLAWSLACLRSLWDM